ncbi:Uncharacterised protein [Candidatus Bilamarchaeum dharawalense]|uniref:Uncharacterized protein n=1 Tax=Candidatus Bilamarchaeum dharawalense TaxID=2885759 RepID=A0A5E4LUM4_9ARCH|nr:Uncharacterised protein [Candidatus Bilamarchaeum dharawalense]
MAKAKRVKKSKPKIKSKISHRQKSKPKIHIKKIKIKPIQKLKTEENILMEPIVLKVALPKESSSQEFSPDLDKLPAWESRQALKNMIFSKGLKFYCLSRASPDFQKVLDMLGTSPFQDVSGHFVICMKTNTNNIIGALDGYIVDDVLVLGRSYVITDKRREFQLLLYAAALTKRESKYVICSTKLTKFSLDFVGMLLLLGRGFGMYAISPFNSTLVFVRRIQKEGPLSTGAEIAHVLRSLRSASGPEVRSAVFDYTQKSLVSLIPLPNSPDRKENLFELREAAPALGFSLESLEKIFELLDQSDLGYKDLTPEILF